MNNAWKLALGASLTSLIAGTAMANETGVADSVMAALSDGDAYIKARARYEYASQDGLPEDSHAPTVRTVLGYKSGIYQGFSGLIEFENVSEIGGDNYNNTINGKTDRPVIADVESTMLNQLFVQYDGLDETALRLGRQVVNLDNQRFIGSVGWRQNDQTLDAFTLTNNSIDDLEVFYGYVDEVNRIFGDDSPVGDFESDSHLIHASYDGLDVGVLSGYGYLLDFGQDAPGLSSQTYGASLVGKLPINDEMSFAYRAEYAQQSDYGDNPLSYDAEYYHIAPSLLVGGWEFFAGYEVLGSDDGTAAFQTPLATAHKFNGWADKFLSTPANGLEDLYAGVGYKVAGVTGEHDWANGLLLQGIYHQFDANEGGASYGDEINFLARLPFAERYYVLAKFADYSADQFATDTQRFTFDFGVRF